MSQQILQTVLDAGNAPTDSNYGAAGSYAVYLSFEAVGRNSRSFSPIAASSRLVPVVVIVASKSL